MDPLSAAFAAYLDTFSTILTDSMQARRNLDVQAHVVEHEGYSITFQHRLWKIRDDSVCADLRQDLKRYSGCTKAAAAWFRETCSQMSSNPADPEGDTSVCGRYAQFTPPGDIAESFGATLDIADVSLRYNTAPMQWLPVIR